MSGKTLKWEKNNGQLGESGNTINVTAGKIEIKGNNFVSFGNWNATDVKCETGGGSAAPVITGTVTSTSSTCGAYVVSKLNQTITFNAQTTSSRTYSPGSTFSISPTATASSGLAVTYSSTTTGVCTVSGTTVTMVSAGTCIIAADQAGNASYNAAAQVTRSIVLTAANPTSFSAYETNITNAAAVTAPVSPITTNRPIMTRVASTTASGTNLCPNGLSTTAASLPTGTKTCSLTIAGFLSGAVATSYSGTVSVKLQYCSNVSRSGSGTSSTVACGGTWADLSAAQTVTLASGVGVGTFAFVNNAYEVVRVYINSSALGITSYSDDYFAIRPGGLTVTATDATVATAGSTRSLTSGAVTHKAGQPFTLNAQAYVTSSATTASNYRGTGAGPVSQTVSTTSPTGTGLVNGTLSPGTWSGSGTVTSSTATYSEVGTFTLTLEDQDYANVDKADGSTTAERYFSGSASLGRFTPDHFTTTVTQGCSAFTYSGQPFTTVVTAYNGLSTPTVTKNYSLTTNTVTLSDAGTATYLTNNTVASSSFSVTTGIATTATPVYTFASKATVPTLITVRATDTDSISSSGYETSATTTIRSGRIRIQNAYGSELLALPVPVVLEYYDTTTGTGWRAGADTCTTLTASNFAYTFPINASNKLVACKTYGTLSGTNPTFTLTLSAPGTGNNGWTDLTLSLGSTAVGNKCISSVTGVAETPANLPWLQFNWLGAGSTNPTARATFGAYKSPLIYRRENY